MTRRMKIKTAPEENPPGLFLLRAEKLWSVRRQIWAWDNGRLSLQPKETA